jgi:hypothetical protein
VTASAHHRERPAVAPRPLIGPVSRVSRVAAVVVLTPLVLLGAATAPGETVLLAVFFAAVAGTLVGLVHAASVDEVPFVPHPAVAAVAAAMIPAAVGGAAILGAAPLGFAVAILVVSLAVAAWGGSGAVPGGATTDPPSLGDLLGALPDDVLFDEWRRAAGPTRTDDADPAGRTELRELLVAELGRRHPAGTARWLSEAPGEPPERYLRGRGDPACGPPPGSCGEPTLGGDPDDGDGGPPGAVTSR